MVQTVIYGEGTQALRFVPIDRHGEPYRVTAATYTLEDLRLSPSSPDRVVASGAATITSNIRTIQLACGPSQPDPKYIKVNVVTALEENRTYRIRQLGRYEAFRVERVYVAPDNVVYSHFDLQNDWNPSDSGSLVIEDIEISANFPSSEADNEDNVINGGGPYQLLWEYDIVSNSLVSEHHLVPQEVWIKRYSVDPLITSDDVLQAYPTIGGRARGRISIWQSVNVASQEWVGDMEAAGKDVAYYRSTNAAKLAVRYKALEYIFRWMQTESDSAQADRFERKYIDLMNSMLVGMPPHGTVVIDRSSNSAETGTSKIDGNSYIRRS